MTCYGRFGEWATVVALALAVAALGPMFAKNQDQDGAWAACIALPALALNGILMMHVREYRSVPLPLWFWPLPFLLPTLVATLDIRWSHRFPTALRVMIAAVATTAIAIATIACVLLLNGPAEEW
jgi:hypothetical protein